MLPKLKYKYVYLFNNLQTIEYETKEHEIKNPPFNLIVL